MSVDGWHPDPYGIHEERLFAHGEATSLVRDDGIGFLDALPAATTTTSVGPVPATTGGGAERRRAGLRRTRPLWTVAALLIAAGAIVGVMGIVGPGSGGSSETATTLNPLVRKFLDLPPATTMSPSGQASQALLPSTTLSSLERALAALPRTTTPAPTTPPATAPAVTVPKRSASVTSGPLATRVTQAPARPPAPKPTMVPTTLLPLTTLTTSVGEADQGWYLAYGSVFNLLQTDLEKLNRALDFTSQNLYSDVHPYWQELYTDANYAISMPPIPDAATESAWASALGDLSEGATECIIGSAGNPGSVGFVPAIFNQGAAFITTGTTQFDNALGSVQSVAAATSGASRSQVRGWYQSHGTAFATLQADVDKLNAAFASTNPADYATLDPYWQQLMSDAGSAKAAGPIPDTLIQSYWSTALDDLVQGAGDCTGSSEAQPPNLFDQGVASIESGTAYLHTSLAAVQNLIG